MEEAAVCTPEEAFRQMVRERWEAFHRGDIDQKERIRVHVRLISEFKNMISVGEIKEIMFEIAQEETKQSRRVAKV